MPSNIDRGDISRAGIINHSLKLLRIGVDSYTKNYFTCTTFWALCHSQLLSLEKVENCDDFYAKYDQLNHEADKINVDNGQYMTFPESYLRLGNLYKDMYKLAKEKKTSKVITE